MKMPRNISGQELVKYLKPYGYLVTRQAGSHIRLTTKINGEHHVTVPNHSPIKIGTLNSIISDIAQHFKKTKEEVINDIFY